MGFGSGFGSGGSLAGAADVTLNNPQEDNLLAYNSAIEKWQNEAVVASGGDGVKSATVVVAANDAPASVKAAADYVCDGVADEVQINNAIASLSTDTIGLGTQGGSVHLWGKNFSLTGAILMRSQVTVFGQGQWATVVRPASSYQPGETGGVFQLYSSNTQYTTVRDLTIHGNASSGSRTCGIYYAQGVAQEWDASHRLLNLYIYAPSHHGIYLTWNASGARNRAFYVQNVRIIDPGTTVNAGAYGVYCDSPDSFFISVDVGTPASHGYYISGGNNRFIGCKAWYCGSLASGAHQGSGFYLWGGPRNELVGCEAQDNYGDGFFVGASDNILSGCMADSNGYNRGGGGGAGIGWTGSGFYLNASRINLQGNALDKNEGSRGIYQRYGVELANSNIQKSIVNVVTGTHGTGSLSGTPHATSIINVV